MGKVRLYKRTGSSKMLFMYNRQNGSIQTDAPDISEDGKRSSRTLRKTGQDRTQHKVHKVSVAKLLFVFLFLVVWTLALFRLACPSFMLSCPILSCLCLGICVCHCFALSSLVFVLALAYVLTLVPVPVPFPVPVPVPVLVPVPVSVPAPVLVLALVCVCVSALVLVFARVFAFVFVSAFICLSLPPCSILP
jgi:hypothetical protein